MRKILYLLMSMAFISCNSTSNEKHATLPASKDTLSIVIEKYISGITNNPKFYKPLKTHPKVLLSSKDSLLIKGAYQTKYQGEVVIDFDKPVKESKPINISDVKENFYTVLHEFEQQNNMGAIIKSNAIVTIDDSLNIISYYIF